MTRGHDLLLLAVSGQKMGDFPLSSKQERSRIVCGRPNLKLGSMIIQKLKMPSEIMEKS